MSYKGQAVYMFAFDLADELGREPVSQLLGQKVEQFKMDPSKRNPRQSFFFRPQMVRLPPCTGVGPHGPIAVERVVKLLPIGAISITVTVPFEVQELRELVD